MKRIQILLIALLGFSAMSVAQVQKRSMTAKISTPGVGCESCKTRIENFLVRFDGVTKVNVDFRRKITNVTWLTDRTNLEEIKTAIANVGYDADDVTANEDSYKRLPTLCKKPADGGHPKPKRNK